MMNQRFHVAKKDMVKYYICGATSFTLICS